MGKVVPLVGMQQVEVPLAHIVEDPFLPRKTFSESALAELAASLQAKGLMQAIVVTQRSEKEFALIIGSRRVRAARAAGYTHVPAVVAAVADSREILFLALSENVQREDLEPMEEANAYIFLCQEYGMSLKAVADGVNRTVSYVRDRIKLLDLAPEVQQFVTDGSLAAATAATLVHVQSGEKQVALAEEAMREGLSASEMRTLLKEEGARHVGEHGGPRAMTVQKYRLHIVKVREHMQRNFAMIERLAMTAEERGRLMQVQIELEQASQIIRNHISASGRVVIPTHSRKGAGNVPTARSHGDEWPAGDVMLLEDASLSDDDIAERIGRTITAVQAMRKELRRKKRRKR